MSSMESLIQKELTPYHQVIEIRAQVKVMTKLRSVLLFNRVLNHYLKQIEKLKMRSVPVALQAKEGDH
jgi:hypothetical protein